MDIQYTYLDLLWYLMVYSLLGWTVEVCIDAVTKGQFVNRGLLNLPFSMPVGSTSVVLMLVLPTISHGITQLLMALAVYHLSRSLYAHFIRRISGAEPADPSGTRLAHFFV